MLSLPTLRPWLTIHLDHYEVRRWRLGMADLGWLPEPSRCPRAGPSARPQLCRALTAMPVPEHVAGQAPSPPEPLHALPAGLTGARIPRPQRAVRPMTVPVHVAGGAPSPDRCRGQPPTARAGP